MPRQAGVGFAINNKLLAHLDSLPSAINERIMSLRLDIGGGRFATIFSVYAPTMSNEEEDKEAFYEQLRSKITSCSPSDKIVLLGDFNARVGTDHTTWEGVIGRHGLGKANSNGAMLLSLCAQLELVITNTMFCQPEHRKGSWKHPRSKRWHMIDYVITRQRDLSDVRVTHSLNGADCDTDHRLIRSRICFSIAPLRRQQQQKPRVKKLNTQRLRDADTRAALQAELAKKLGTQTEASDSTTIWSELKANVYSTAKQVLGYHKRKQADWFDESEHIIRPLLDARNTARERLQGGRKTRSLSAALTNAKRALQAGVRQAKNAWLEEKARQIQAFADNRDPKRFYDAINELYGPSGSKATSIRSKDCATLLTDKKQILERWREHFSELLNCPSSVDQSVIDTIEQHPIAHELDEPPNEGETLLAIKQMNAGKAPGEDGLPAELFKHGGPALVQRLVLLFNAIWTEGHVPQDMKDAEIVTIYKRKGDKSECGNYRGISLLSIAGKILARIMLNRLTKCIVDRVLPESQCGFRAGRGTIDMIFAVRQVLEKAREQNRDLYLMFVDLTKAFDSVNRDALWKVLSKCGCPPKFLKIVQQLHDDMHGSVTSGTEKTSRFAITTGVKQGCVLAPTLFCIYFACVLGVVVEQINHEHPDCGVSIRTRPDGRLFHLSDLKCKKTLSALIIELLYADDVALCSHTEIGLQTIASKLAAACAAFGLTISLKKTEVLLQPAPYSARVEPIITINGTRLNVVHKFTYLGSIVSDDGQTCHEIETRIRKASVSFGKLNDRVWSNHGIRLHTKLEVYKAVVLSTLLYGCETWTCYRRDVAALDRFHHRHLRIILGIKWQDLVPNTEVLNRCNMTGIESYLFRHRLRWTGHVMRMDDNRLPRLLLLSELTTGNRKVGRPQLRFKDTVKYALKQCSIDEHELDRQSRHRNPALSAADDRRAAWRSSVHQGVLRFEQQRIQKAAEQRARRKERIALRQRQPNQ